MFTSETYSALLSMDDADITKEIERLAKDPNVTADHLEDFLVNLNIEARSFSQDAANVVDQLLLLLWQKYAGADKLQHARRILAIAMQENISEKLLDGFYSMFNTESYLVALLDDLTAHQRVQYALYLIAQTPEAVRNEKIGEENANSLSYLTLLADVLGMSGNNIDVEGCHLDELATTLWHVFSDALCGVAYQSNDVVESSLADYGRILSLIFKVETST